MLPRYCFQTKPSRGCTTCKKRKIKCDLSEPVCTNCSRAGWTCPGYKSQFDQNLRNQTELVIRKAQADQSNDDTSNQSLNLRRCSQSSHKPIRPRHVSPPIVDQATAFFFHQYVFGADQQSPVPVRGNHEYLPTLHRAGGSSGALAAITAAAGLAGLANAGNSPAWTSQAYQLYGKAIRQIRVAISDPAELKSDQTLAAIMLMGTFEAITCINKDSMKSVGYHTIAAARIIDIRGPEQFCKNETATRLFLQIRRLIILTAHQMQEPMPYAMGKWSSWAKPSQRDDEHPANQFSDIMEQFAAVRAQMKYQGITNPSVIESLFKPIDRLLQEWRNALPSSWSPKSCNISTPGSSEFGTLDSQHDMYPDMWIASMWNNYRSARILIHETLMSVMMKNTTAEKMVNLQSSIDILREMTVGICRSVSYHLGYWKKNEDGQILPDLHCREYQATPGGYLIIWPLYMAGMLPTTTKEHRQWIAEKLYRIAFNMGARLAFSLGTILYQEDEKFFSNTEMWVIEGSVSRFSC